MIIKKKKRTYYLVHFAALADHKAELKQGEKQGFYQHLSRVI